MTGTDSPFDEDHLVALLADRLDDVASLAEILGPTIDRFVPLARKSQWVAAQVAATGAIPPPSESFRADWLGSWLRFYVDAARASRGDGVPFDLDATGPTLYLTWHEPRYPLLLRSCGRHGALALLAQPCTWMARAAGPDNVYVFRDDGPPRELVRAMTRGRTVVAMFDYCYDETASVVVPFLGRPCRTPLGLPTLAARFGYAIEVVSWNRHGPRVVLSTRAAGQEPADLAAAVNAALTHEIAEAPESWLLWPSLDRRWPPDVGSSPTAQRGAGAPSGL